LREARRSRRRSLRHADVEPWQRPAFSAHPLRQRKLVHDLNALYKSAD